MTTTAGSTLAHDPSASDIYDPDEVFPRNSPLMKPHSLKLKPSPSPPAVPLPQVCLSPSSPGRKSSNRRRNKFRPTQGDAVLIFHLGGGKRPEVEAEAGLLPLVHSNSEDDHSASESEGTIDDSGDEVDGRSTEMSPLPSARTANFASHRRDADPIEDLQSLATNALAAATAATTKPDDEAPRNASQEPRGTQRAQRARLPEILNVNGPREDVVMRDADKPVLAPPISPYPSQGLQDVYSPRRQSAGSGLMHPNSIRSPTSLTPVGHGELPPMQSPGAPGDLAPIQMASPKSDSSNHEALPSIRSQLADQLATKELPLRYGAQYPHSPPSGAPRLGSISGTHGSPPISPNELYRRPSHGIPSPASTLPVMSPYYSSASSTGNPRHGLDYGESPNTETNILTPAPSIATSITDRMSIDNMTNPQIGQFVCNFEGCNAAPFQTQYLLNSHANVHSSARPHYCSVKGCPRSEGGKGFKRKNEMIRHGLVHDSPGHVRVHHVDKDKDDPLLRDVLAQRPDGPNRGRRRRGGP
ncbi:hypothetical protein F5Y15DRAFT_143927 [Xylariaceae sp. FL0016]|nr:hypothetical protein F5Y15DRAFT_143927 [Xylariaceae sp. FL0016]